MAGLRVFSRSNRRSEFSPLRLALVLCLALLLLLVMTHAAIGHRDSSNADRCPLCVAMHTLLPFTIMAAAEILVRLQTLASEITQDPAIARYWHPTLFNRPPPFYS